MSSVTRVPLDDALTCISCGVPHTIRALDRSHVVSRARDPSRVDDPSNKVRQCRLCHTEIEPKGMARHKVEDGVYTYESWSDEECSFVVGRQVKVKVDKRRGHLVEAEGVEAGQPCSKCRGNGRIDMLEHCPDCNGSGQEVSKRDVDTPRHEPTPEPPKTDTESVEEGVDELVEAGSAAAEGVSAGRTPTRRPEPQAADEPSKVNSRAGLSAAAPPASAKSSATDRGAQTGSTPVPTQPSSVAEPFSLETWCEQGMKLVYLGLALRGAKEAWQLSVGDWCNQGENRLGNEAFGYIRPFKDGAVRQYTWVAGRIPLDARVPDLSYAHHRAVAALEPPKQKDWLAKAQKENMTSDGLYRAIHGEKPPTMGVCFKCGAEGKLSEFRRAT